MVVAARGLAAADVDPLSPRQILAKQQAYFNSIKSIEFYSTFTMSRSPEMTARMEQEGNPPRTKIEQALHLIIDGDKFRAEATLTDFTTWQPFTAIHAFDGDRYQLLYQPEQPPQPVLMPDRPYVVIDPLTSIYGFALGEGMEASLRTLRDEVFWSRLEGMVLGCEAARVNDTDGIRLRLNVPDKVGEGDIPLELFFPAEDGLRAGRELPRRPARSGDRGQGDRERVPHRRHRPGRDQGWYDLRPHSPRRGQLSEGRGFRAPHDHRDRPLDPQGQPRRPRQRVHGCRGARLPNRHRHPARARS